MWSRVNGDPVLLSGTHSETVDVRVASSAVGMCLSPWIFEWLQLARTGRKPFGRNRAVSHRPDRFRGIEASYRYIFRATRPDANAYSCADLRGSRREEASASGCSKGVRRSVLRKASRCHSNIKPANDPDQIDVDMHLILHWPSDGRTFRLGQAKKFVPL